MANIARGKAECFIFYIARGKAIFQVSAIKNFFAITKHTNCANYVDTSRQIRTNFLFCYVYYLYWPRMTV